MGRLTDSSIVYWDDAIINALNSGRLTILTGSALSMFGPTYLPTGSYSASTIKNILLREYLHEVAPKNKRRREQLEKRIRELINDLPFESVIELLVQATSPAKAENLIHNLITTNKFNLVHRILADLMATSPATEGPSLAIITTNYDLGIENAILKTQPTLRYRSIVTQSDALKPLGHEPVLFKIHGSDAHFLPYQFVMTHDQEFSFLSGKIKFSINLLMIGYSSSLAIADWIWIYYPRLAVANGRLSVQYAH